MTKQRQTHDPKKRPSKEPTDYNSALLSITQQNDDILTNHRAKSGPIIPNLMPVPSPKETSAMPPNPPTLPPKKIGLKIKKCASMELNRTMHKDGKPVNQFEHDNVKHIKVNRPNIQTKS